RRADAKPCAPGGGAHAPSPGRPRGSPARRGARTPVFNDGGPLYGARVSPVIWPGQPHTLGARVTREGVNFALFSETATRVELCLFDAPHRPPTATLELPERAGRVFCGFVPGL